MLNRVYIFYPSPLPKKEGEKTFCALHGWDASCYALILLYIMILLITYYMVGLPLVRH